MRQIGRNMIRCALQPIWYTNDFCFRVYQKVSLLRDVTKIYKMFDVKSVLIVSSLISLDNYIVMI